MRSEKEILDWLRARLKRARTRGLALGLGDDAALLRLRPTCQLVVTTDLFLEDVHFRRQWMTAAQAGYKAVARALSDLAAMGAAPRFLFLSVAVPRALGRRWLEQFFRGAVKTARAFRVALAGGDLGSAQHGVVVDVTSVGEVERSRALLRSGARPGDAIFLTGTAGLARAGLEVLRRGLERRSVFAPAVRTHVRPVPRCAVGRYLVRRRLASAAIDTSDGLSTDLNHICEESKVGARIEASRIPLPATAAKIRDLLRLDPFSLALHGGEDYELLFTVPAARVRRLPAKIQGVRVTRIGEITRARRVVLVEVSGRERVLRAGGFDHFR